MTKLALALALTATGCFTTIGGVTGAHHAKRVAASDDTMVAAQTGNYVVEGMLLGLLADVATGYVIMKRLENFGDGLRVFDSTTD